mgnify:CR=1 FL=1
MKRREQIKRHLRVAIQPRLKSEVGNKTFGKARTYVENELLDELSEKDSQIGLYVWMELRGEK